MRASKQTSKGFTLIEMSIVLVIIGLIIAGVLVGKDMVTNARVMKIINEVNNYTIAVDQFSERFSYLPGDFPNAWSYWPSEGCSNSWVGASGAGCNGNGNGQIYSFPGREQLRAWQHLSLSGLVPQSYTGVLDGNAYRLGVNVAPSSAENAAYMIRYDASNTYNGKSGNNIMLGAKSGLAFLWGPALNSVNAWKIDKKLDDGTAWTGKVIGVDGYDGAATATGCVDNGSTTPSNYVLTNNEVKCRMHFFLKK